MYNTQSLQIIVFSKAQDDPLIVKSPMGSPMEETLESTFCSLDFYKRQWDFERRHWNDDLEDGKEDSALGKQGSVAVSN